MEELNKIEKNIEILQKISHTRLVQTAIVIDHTLLYQLPKEKYVEVAIGVHDRVIENKDDIKFEFEQILSPVLQSIDFDQYFVLAVRIKDHGFFHPHIHDFRETIIPITGTYADIDNKIYRPGSKQIVEPFVVHAFFPMKTGLVLILIDQIPSNNGK